MRLGCFVHIHHRPVKLGLKRGHGCLPPFYNSPRRRSIEHRRQQRVQLRLRVRLQRRQLVHLGLQAIQVGDNAVLLCQEEQKSGLTNVLEFRLG